MRESYFSRSSFALACLFPTALGSAPLPDERGLPLMERYTAKDFHAENVVQDIAIAADGCLYVPNKGGVLVYDGTSWRFVKVPASWVYGVAEGPDGRIYVSGENELGRLVPSPTGELRYESLRPALPAGVQQLGTLRYVRRAGDTLYFSSASVLLSWRAERLHELKLGPAKVTALLPTGAGFYLYRPLEGLYRRLRDGADDFELVAHSREFPAPAISSLAEGPDARLLVGLAPAGLAWFDPMTKTVTPVAGPLAERLRRPYYYSLLRLPDGRYAAGTIGQGLWLLAPDLQGGLHLDRSSGLSDNTAARLAVDAAGGLWVGSFGGLCRLNLAAPGTVFDERTGINPVALKLMTRHAGIMYATSEEGLLRLVPGDPAQGKAARFERLPNSPPGLRPLVSHPTGLIVGGAGAAYRVGQDGTFTKLYAEKDRLFRLTFSRRDPTLFFMSAEDILLIARLAPDGLRIEGRHPLGNLIDDIRETEAGELWIGTASAGIWRVRPGRAPETWRNPELRRYGNEQGVPTQGGSASSFTSALGLHFDSGLQALHFDATADRFVPAPPFLVDGRPASLFHVQSLSPGVLWAACIVPTATAPLYSFGRFVLEGDRFRWAPPPAVFRELMSHTSTRHLSIDRRNGGTAIWAQVGDVLLRLEGDVEVPAPRADWRAVIRGFHVAGAAQPIVGEAVRRVPFVREKIAFSYAAPRLGGGALRFQARLIGYDDAWSSPTAATETSFTNLEGGPFRFEVRAIDGDGRASAPAALEFFVVPPWPRRPVAYAGYALLALSAVAGFIRWRLRAGERERERLEGLVGRRTAELQVAKEQADAANKAKTLFLANMSHELRTPLNAILGYAQLLRKNDGLPARDRERLAVINASGEHLLRLINDVLDLAKIEAGRMELHESPIDLPQLLDAVATTLGARAREKGIAFVAEFDPALPPRVIGDASKLRQVLENLVGNAIKFTRHGSVTLAVRAHREDQEAGRKEPPAAGGQSCSRLPPPCSDASVTLAFSVSDTGAGISGADREKIFEVFGQATEGRPPEPGTGLGLPLCRRLLALMESRLEVESTLGAGSRFHFTLRLSPAPVASALPLRPHHAVGYTGQRRQILVVDDVTANRALLRDMLEPLGFIVTEAANGAATLERAAQTPPDAVLLDLRLPDIHGLTVVRRLRQSSAGVHLKIFAVSASALTIDRREVLAAGCDDFLPKPFRESDLLAKLGAALSLEWIEGAPPPAASDTSPRSGRAPAEMLTPEILRELLAYARDGQIVPLRQRVEFLATTAGDPLVDEIAALVNHLHLQQLARLLKASLASRKLP